MHLHNNDKYKCLKCALQAQNIYVYLIKYRYIVLEMHVKKHQKFQAIISNKLNKKNHCLGGRFDKSEEFEFFQRAVTASICVRN